MRKKKNPRKNRAGGGEKTKMILGVVRTAAEKDEGKLDGVVKIKTKKDAGEVEEDNEVCLKYHREDLGQAGSCPSKKKKKQVI
jgi:hypothetical protein